MSKRPYKEHLLHWIWKNRLFDTGRLVTTGKKSLRIYNPGTVNPSDGPDFLNAHIQIGKLSWHGDIEIHWNEGDWQKHDHHKNPNFNRVVLHVTYEMPTQNTALRPDNTRLPTFCLKPYLEKPLHHFFNNFKNKSRLPCSSHTPASIQEVFHSQIQIAHSEYFEQKVDDLMEFYDSRLPLEKAWKNMITIALFDGLGIAHNRASMQQVGRDLIYQKKDFSTLDACIAQAQVLAGLKKDSQKSTPQWNRKGCRPANRPNRRIPQAAELYWIIQNIKLNSFIKKDIQNLWGDIFAAFSAGLPPGKQRRNILFGTVWLPALFILGNLLHSKKLKQHTRQQWQDHQVKIPQSIRNIFQDMPVKDDFFDRYLGTVYQFRYYCKPRNCQKCKVFKSIISS